MSGSARLANSTVRHAERDYTGASFRAAETASYVAYRIIPAKSAYTVTPRFEVELPSWVAVKSVETTASLPEFVHDEDTITSETPVVTEGVLRIHLTYTPSNNERDDVMKVTVLEGGEQSEFTHPLTYSPTGPNEEDTVVKKMRRAAYDYVPPLS